MKRILLLIPITIFTLYLSITAQVTNFKVNRVGIGSPYSEVIKNLGKPSSVKKGGIVPFSDGSILLTLRYKGLEILLSKAEDERTFSVFSMRASSSQWSVLGISVGATMKTIKTKFGQPYHQTRESGLLGLHYNNNQGISGAASFYFRGNRLREVVLYLNYC